jgi:hypothetical protein
MQHNPLMWHIQVSLACTLLLCGAFGASSAIRAQARTVVEFAEFQPGRLPPGFRTLHSAGATPGRWEVVQVDGVMTLAQTDVRRGGYRLAVLERSRAADVRMGTRLRMGPGDRAAGVVWRVQDATTYYAARLDLASNEFIVYKFVRGNRVRLSRVRNLRLDAADWHEIEVEHVGDRLRVWLNGIPVASERDEGLRDPGMVGFWIPGDSAAHYRRIWYETVSRD